MNFQWIPPQALDYDAIERMKLHFKQPEEAPPEAWFNTFEQRYYPGLLEALVNDPQDLSYVEHALDDIAGGLINFGRLPIWVDWFHFLLPYLVEHLFDQWGDLLPKVINVFFNVYPDRIIEDYPGFRQDVFHTLATRLMAEHLWSDVDLAVDQRWFDQWGGYWQPSFIATMFFCLKYLEAEEIDGWIDSIVAINGEHWQSEVRRWLQRADRFLYYTEQPEATPQVDPHLDIRDSEPLYRSIVAADLAWDGSYTVLSGLNAPQTINDFLPPQNIDAFWQAVKKYPHLTYS